MIRLSAAPQRPSGWADGLLERLAAESLLSDIRWLTPEEVREAFPATAVTLGFQGQQVVADRSVTLRVGLQSTPGLELLKVQLTPWDALGFIPHVDLTGNVCYLNAEGLILDRSRPKALVADCLELTKAVLEDGYSGTNRADFMDEFDAYWLQTLKFKRIQAFVNPTDHVKKLTVAEAHRKVVYIADDVKAVRAYLSGREPEHHTLRNALYIPLNPETRLVPPRPGTMWSAQEIRELVYRHTSPRTRKTFCKFLRKCGNEAVVVLKLPRPSGGESLIGIHFHSVGGTHPLRPEGNAQTVTPLVLNRFDEAYIVPRGGARRGLRDKRVLLIGCGAIGGFLAHNLAQTGLSQLTLVDPERLTQENIYRHWLGRRHLGKAKSEALKHELTEQLPYLRIECNKKRIEEALSDGSVALSEYDLVVSALGIPTLELYLNERIHQEKGAPPLIVSWLEPYGIGGHALLTNVPGAPPGGCFECLVTDAADDPPLFNRASFAAADQTFAKNIAGCGSLFTPFASLDAVHTAELAARLSVQTLEGRVAAHPIRSWKGDPQDFLEAGYALSPRFGLSDQELYSRRLAYIDTRCPVCSRKAL